MEDVGWGSLPQVVKGLVWSLIWFIYLSVSNQVAELFPKENRRVFNRDKYFAGSLLAIPALLFSDNIYHSFEAGDSILGTITGVFDTNTTESYFKECLDSWRDESLDGYDFSVSDISTRPVNHNMLRMQSVEYVTDPRLVWTFAALYSPETGKACIVSCFAAISVEQAESLYSYHIPRIHSC